MKHPEILEGNKSNTLNGMGFVFFTPSQISEKFIKQECIPKKHVLEIGAGFGDLPVEALKGGVSTYYANDVSDEHLDILKQKVILKLPDKISQLKIIKGKAPEILKHLTIKFDAIIADKVMHFFTPDEINEFIKLSKSLLKKNGKLYITTASPYSKRYSGMLEEYLIKKESGDKFPGYFTDVMSRLNHSEIINNNYQNYQVPNSMVLFARDDLVKLFEDCGMKILQSYSLQIPTNENPRWLICPDDQSNLVGIIAANN